jgi:hypothetical protein
METKKYNIRIDNINIVEKSLSKAIVDQNTKYNFETKVQLLIDDTKKLVVAFVGVYIRKESDNSDMANIMCAVGYFIENFDDIFEKDENSKVIIPPDLDNLFKSTSISTVRGLLYSELRGTALHGAILPLISMDSFVPVSSNLVDIIEVTKPN